VLEIQLKVIQPLETDWI